MSAGFRLSPRAEADIDEIWLYIAEDDIRAANIVRDRIVAGLQRLAEFPHVGHTRQDLAPGTLLFWPVGRYLIVYRPETDPLEIVRVINVYRDVPRVLG